MLIRFTAKLFIFHFLSLSYVLSATTDSSSSTSLCIFIVAFAPWKTEHFPRKSSFLENINSIEKADWKCFRGVSIECCQRGKFKWFYKCCALPNVCCYRNRAVWFIYECTIGNFIMKQFFSMKIEHIHQAGTK